MIRLPKPIRCIFIASLTTAFFLYGCSAVRSIAKYPSKKKQTEFSQLPNNENGEFKNKYEQPSPPIYLYEWREDKETKRNFFTRPRLSKEIPSVKTNLLDTVYSKPTIIWFGHSSYLIQSKGFNILVDPVLSDYASPIWFINKSIPGSNVYSLKDLPPIDLLLITHDHYDHLDYRTARKLRKTQTSAIVPLGVGTILDYWGWKPSRFHEMNWGDTITLSPDIRIISTPANHFSGRWMKKARTLWTSYVLEIHGYKIFIGGDSGYNKHFRDIGNQYGPFDIAVLENGQYNTAWIRNHSFPEQTVHTAQELQAKMVLPVHWAKFKAAYHTWNEPINELIPLLDSIGIPITVPRIGEPYTIGEPPKIEIWWDFE